MRFSDAKELFSARAAAGTVINRKTGQARSLSDSRLRVIVSNVRTALAAASGLPAEAVDGCELGPYVASLAEIGRATAVSRGKDDPRNVAANIKLFLAALYGEYEESSRHGYAHRRPVTRERVLPDWLPLYDTLVALADEEPTKRTFSSQLVHFQDLALRNDVRTPRGVPDNFVMVSGWARDAGMQSGKFQAMAAAFRTARLRLGDLSLATFYQRVNTSDRGLRGLPDLTERLAHDGREFNQIMGLGPLGPGVRWRSPATATHALHHSSLRILQLVHTLPRVAVFTAARPPSLRPSKYIQAHPIPGRPPMRIRRMRFVLLAVLFLTPVPATAQSLLVIPDIALASIDHLEARKAAAESFRARNPNATDVQVDSAVAADVQSRNRIRDWVIGEMGAELSEQFWGEAGSRVLPGSSLGFSSDKAALYTELGAVVSGSWRFSAGTTLSVSTTETTETEGDDNTGLNRFIAGGGGLSLQVLRPAALLEWGDLTRVGLFFVPRVWTNLPSLKSTDGLKDYGGEVAATLVVQRHDNRNRPFLTLETRVGLVGGSSEFYDTVESDDAKRFLYLAPTLTMRVIDNVNIGVSTFISESFDSPGLRLNLSLLNKDADPSEE